jgi:hypothetical protein
MLALLAARPLHFRRMRIWPRTAPESIGVRKYLSTAQAFVRTPLFRVLGRKITGADKFRLAFTFVLSRELQPVFRVRICLNNGSHQAAYHHLFSRSADGFRHGDCLCSCIRGCGGFVFTIFLSASASLRIPIYFQLPPSRVVCRPSVSSLCSRTALLGLLLNFAFPSHNRRGSAHRLGIVSTFGTGSRSGSRCPSAPAFGSVSRIGPSRYCLGRCWS